MSSTRSAARLASRPRPSVMCSSPSRIAASNSCRRTPSTCGEKSVRRPKPGSGSPRHIVSTRAGLVRSSSHRSTSSAGTRARRSVPPSMRKKYVASPGGRSGSSSWRRRDSVTRRMRPALSASASGTVPAWPDRGSPAPARPASSTVRGRVPDAARAARPQRRRRGSASARMPWRPTRPARSAHTRTGERMTASDAPDPGSRLRRSRPGLQTGRGWTAEQCACIRRQAEILPASQLATLVGGVLRRNQFGPKSRAIVRGCGRTGIPAKPGAND